MKSPKAVALLKKLAIMVISGSIGAVSIIPIARGLKTSRNPVIEWIRESSFELLIILPLMMLTLIGCFVLAVAAHECGHVLAGWWARFRFAFLLFWPIQVRRRGDRGITVRTLFRSGMGLGGVAGMTPEPGTDMRRGYLTLLAGGPGASLICGLAGIGLHLALRNAFPLAAGVVWTFSLFSVFLFITSMIPSHAGGFLSDGAAIRLLRKGSPQQVEPYLAMMEISTQWALGTRPAEWSRDSLERLEKAPPDDPLSTRAPFFAFMHAVDRGDLREARLRMNELLVTIDQVPLLLRPQYRLMEAWLSAREGRPEEARAILPLAQGGLMEPCERAMVEAVILAEEGRRDESREKAAEALALMSEAMIPESHRFARDQCEALIG